ncbi:MAG: hypothetical protein ABF651_04955 [Sporolactobacillus sp.]
MQSPANHKKTGACHVLIILQIFLGIGAFFGGLLLVLAPDGSLLYMPLYLLRTSIFHSYLIPGIILCLVLGVYPLVTAWFLISEKPFAAAERLNLYKKTHWAWSHSLYTGFILVIWLTIEMYEIQAVGIVHLFYMFLALAILAVTLLPSVKNHYSRL